MENLLRSRAAAERLGRVMPGGNTRSATYYDPFPVVLSRGEGCRVFDVDGNEYLDVLNNYTAMIHGHAHPVITACIVEAASRGSVFPSPHLSQAELGERIVARFRSIERLRFCNSGTEAVMVAIRAARAFTGRDVIVKLLGGYHGSWDQVAVGAHEDVPSDGAPTAGPDYDRGIPHSVRELVLQVPANDTKALQHVMERHGPRIAAILLEPVLGHVVVPLSHTYLEAARALATQYGALLVLDEVVTARLHEGGAQAIHGIAADLTTLGKIIGGGLPIGAFGGRLDVMAQFDPHHPEALSHHGTYNGATLAMVAGAASLDLLPQAEIERINALGARLATGVAQQLKRAEAEGSVTSAGSLLHVHSERMAEIHLACLASGLYMAPRGQMSISTPMNEAIVDEAITRFGTALSRLQR